MMKIFLYASIAAFVFQPFSSLGTFETLLSVLRNLDTQNGANLRILTEPSEE